MFSHRPPRYHSDSKTWQLRKMKLSDFDYRLPPELIAQRPLASRDRSRMLIVRRGEGSIASSHFYELPSLLGKGDCLVVNNSKVIPARLVGRKDTGGTVELLLVSKKESLDPSRQTWEVLLKRAKKIRSGMRIAFGELCEAFIAGRASEKKWLVTFIAPGGFDRFLDHFGRPPLPPYIKRMSDKADAMAYQTVYAFVPGSVAAPTAGLHFTQEILERLADRGVSSVSVTLHVGYGTFSPIETPLVEDHIMEDEHYEIGEEAADAINLSARVVAVGTTSTRVLESASDENGRIRPSSSNTGLFIYPGYRFKRVDALLTNFHLPRSSLYLLVCAFAGKDLVEKAYEKAIAERYRFYSYGDCMLIL